MRRIALTAAFVIASALAACTTPPASPPAGDAPTTSATPTPASPTPAGNPPAATPAPTRAPVAATPAPVTGSPADPVRQPALAAPGVVDRSCRTDADCTIKDVGSCCGTYPACVNVNSPADPRAVQAECARKGMQSTCEVPNVQSCSCSAGQCAANGAVSI